MAPGRRQRLRQIGCLLAGIGLFCACAVLPAQTQKSKKPGAPSVPLKGFPAEARGAARFRDRVEALLSGGGVEKGYWGILVTEAATGKVLFARNADSYFMPASNAKLFTTALALATLGPDFRVKTTVLSSSAADADGVLQGDLQFIGAGDANLSNRKFPFVKREERDGPPEKVLAEFADAVVARGIREITGDVIADDSVFLPERFPSGWAIDDMQWSYGAAVSAIAVNDNIFTIELRPGAHEGLPARLDTGFAADFYTLENSVITSAASVEEKLAVARDPGSRVIRLTGSIPSSARARVLTLAIEQPAEYAAALLAHLLEERGVKVDGESRARHAGDPPEVAPAATTILAEHVSRPLSDDVRLTNKNSENLHAELMLLLAAREKTGTAGYDDALKYASDFYISAGVAEGDITLSDGSGLSRKDLVTPRAVVQLLRYASEQPWAELFRTSLPVAGEDGTLADRMKGTPAAGRIFAKTGTIGRTNALSGYAETLSGERLIFSILGNNDSAHVQDANRVIDAISVAMVEEFGRKGKK